MDPSTTNPLTIAGLTATAVLSLLLAALLASLRWGGTYSALRLASEAAFLEEHDRRIDAVVAHDVARRYKLGRRVGSGGAHMEWDRAKPAPEVGG